MSKLLLAACLLMTSPLMAQVNHKSTTLPLNQETSDRLIRRDEEQDFRVNLRKDQYYTIIAEQKGIDLVLTLKDKNGKTIKKIDSPNGRFGPEKMIFSPDTTAPFSLTLKPLADSSNSNEGKYSIVVKSLPAKLPRFTTQQLYQDFDILKNAFIETRVGLWYSSYALFDSLCSAQRNKIRNNMNALEFYRIMAPVVTYTHEGHCNIRPSDETGSYIRQNYGYFPFLVKILQGKIYILNDLDGLKTRGLMITKINGQSADSIMQVFRNIEPGDGYSTTSFDHWIGSAFSRYYASFFNPVTTFDLELEHPGTHQKTVYKNVPACSVKRFVRLSDSLAAALPNYRSKDGATFVLDSSNSTGILTVTSFSLDDYEGRRKGFKRFLAETFKTLKEQQVKHLVIDVRDNGGGEQGMEDHLLSYLISKPYSKYKYVEIPAFTFSFLRYSDRKKNPAGLTQELQEEFYQAGDGRYLNKKGYYEGDSVKADHFDGDLCILISGYTFSGGSEFAAMAKNYTRARFIGEETGGGYYGNTSGTFIRYILPNTQLTGRIPLCKFVPETLNNSIPFGHGVIPDHYIQPTIDDYLNGRDVEMAYAKALFAGKSKP
ncbi:S41 family peptidase [Taibaiella chishuiensis]|uniref:Peptidase S41-like protein n=1 Tax=Taibaiella chishuiensis TaxID=1434707 RepID=A0A2P8D4R3_9BACT|nr:S41 family peptidase [Taibaiella chishuiensis]PSK92203.1 peptidase S41-like protein [Taibaiella chishuiensis]